MTSGWTEERVATLTELWEAGLSAAEISRRMGDLTRNAVIGKVHRLGLSGRRAPARETEPPRPAVVVASAHVRRPCQWPFGDPGEPDFHFCGQEAEAGRPYCHEHVVRAYHRASEKSATVNATEAA